MARDAEEILSPALARGPRGSAGERTDFDDLVDDDPADQEPSILARRAVHPAEADAARYGLTFTLPRAFVGNPYPGVSIPAHAREKTWLVTIQVFTQATGGESSFYSYVTAVINYGQGQARFTRTIQLPASQIPVKFTLVARYLDISFFYTNAAPTTPAVISAAVVEAGYQGPDAYAWVWSPNPKTGTTSFGNVWTGPGVLGQVHAMVTGVSNPGTPIWILGFDQTAAQPGGGAQPIVAFKLGAIFNNGDDRSYGDEFAPGSIFWVSGLTLAMSTNPDTYQAVPAGNFFSADVKVGQ